MNRNTIREIVEHNAYLREKLFFKGFFLTNDNDIRYDEYPFCEDWTVKKLNEQYTLAVHNSMPFHLKRVNDHVTMGMVGHAYDPINEEICENNLLERLADVVNSGGEFFRVICDWTGFFFLFVINNKTITFLNDVVGLYSVFYTKDKTNIYISSHSNMIGDILGLEEDPFVTKLKACRTFYYFGNQLPGDITQFANVKRLNPNHFCEMKLDSIVQKRFYWPHSLDLSRNQVRSELIMLLKKTMSVISKKWNRPALSLTGGCDSKTILSCMGDQYGDFSYFSYDSQPNERPDAEAASVICKALGLPHTIYNIPYDDLNFENVEEARAVLIWNGGNIRQNNANDVRKRLYLDHVEDFDVEIKSWVSEIGRARYTKRYNGKKYFGKRPTPRKCTTFYKFLFFNRWMVNRCDKIFKQYLHSYFEQDEKKPIPWQDQFYWEWHWPSRDGVNCTSEQIFSNDITFPYNNRRILELLLSVSYEDRIRDSLYTEIRDLLDDRIDKASLTVVDVNHTNKRAKLEKIYYVVNTLLPF